jgi:predicted ATPase/DNA-binding CsgD family transcriptional regulator
MSPRTGVTVAERISEREAEVLAALGARLSNAQIANQLHISVRTVESHVSSLLRKHRAADRWGLAELARSGAREPGRIAGLRASGTTFVGRGAERAAVLAAIEEARLVTLLGPGGVGKTRLAAVVAEESVALFPSGGAFVDLVPVRDGFVARAVATALGVTEGSHQPLAEAVAARLGTGRWLLVLDNCEHVIDEAAGFAERILAACPGTRVLVTSRERLGVPGERSVPISPLPLGADAERLFRDRALAADPQFVAEPAVIAELCARLDGLPLAIELAAARGASLGATGLLAALEDALRLLSGGRGGEERHRSLYAVLTWSFDLLSEEEQTLFRRLGVFVGTFDMDAAAAVGGDRASVADLLGRLADKSLVVHVRGRVSRWRLLETVRAFALAQLAAAGEEDKTRARHLHWAADAAGTTEGRLSDPAWREDFDAMAADLRAALTLSGGPDEVTHRLARALARLTFARRHLLESFAHHRTAAAVATSAASAARDLRAGAGCAHVSTTSSQHVYELLLQAAGQAQRAGDERGRAIDLARAVAAARAGIDDDLLRDTHITASRLVQPLVLAGRFRDAIGYAERMWDQWERAGRPEPRWRLPAVYTTVLACAMLEEPESVARWRSRAAEVAGGALRTAPVAVFVDARLAVHSGRFDDAESLARTAFALKAPLDPYLAYARAASAELAVAARLPGAADLLSAAAPLTEENDWATAFLARARGRLNEDRTELTRALMAWERLDAQAERDYTQTLLAQL